jgi:DNA-binding CsgD family transcriptional regulator
MAQFINKQQLKSLPCFTHHEDIVTLCQPLFKLGVSNYVYVRTYADGSEFRLGNRSDWLEHYYTQGLYQESIFERTPQYYQPDATPWSTVVCHSTLVSHSRILDSAKNDFNIDHGMTILNKENDYCEKIFFASASANPGVINLYLNDMDLLLNFNRYFKERASPLINEAKLHRLYLQCNEQLNALQQQDLDTVNRKAVGDIKKELKIVSPHNPLSPREQQIADLLVQGYTAAQIAEKFFLSRRTVEAHTVNMKEKLQVRNKAQLLRALLSVHK